MKKLQDRSIAEPYELKRFLDIVQRQFDRNETPKVTMDLLHEILYKYGALSFLANHPLDNLRRFHDAVKLLSEYAEINFVHDDKTSFTYKIIDGCSKG